ncbi:MAG: sugar transferase [Planctomycetota bacterium]
MLKRTRLFPRILVDAIACAACLVLVRQIIPPLEAWIKTDWQSPGLSVVGPVAFFCFPFLVMLLLLGDLYEIARHRTPFQTLRTIIVIGVICGLLYAVLAVLIESVFAPPFKTILLAGSVSLIVLWLLRVTFPAFYSRPWKCRRMLLCGAHTFAIRALQRFARDHSDEMEVIGVVDDFKGGVYFENLEIPFLGGRQALSTIVETHKPDTIVVLTDQSEYATSVINLLETHEVVREVYVRAQIPLFVAQDIDFLFVQEVPLLKLFERGEGTMTRAYRFRDLADKLIAFVFLVLASPLFAIMPILIRLESKGPVFYRQKRLGLNNQPFWIFKFRTMVADAEKKSGAVLAQKNDPP